MVTVVPCVSYLLTSGLLLLRDNGGLLDLCIPFAPQTKTRHIPPPIVFGLNVTMITATSQFAICLLLVASVCGGRVQVGVHSAPTGVVERALNITEPTKPSLNQLADHKQKHHDQTAPDLHSPLEDFIRFVRSSAHSDSDPNHGAVNRALQMFPSLSGQVWKLSSPTSLLTVPSTHDTVYF